MFITRITSYTQGSLEGIQNLADYLEDNSQYSTQFIDDIKRGLVHSYISSKVIIEQVAEYGVAYPFLLNSTIIHIINGIEYKKPAYIKGKDTKEGTIVNIFMLYDKNTAFYISYSDYMYSEKDFGTFCVLQFGTAELEDYKYGSKSIYSTDFNRRVENLRLRKCNIIVISGSVRKLKIYGLDGIFKIPYYKYEKDYE